MKPVLGVLWLLFLPNTAYLFTDFAHVVHQWGSTASPAGHALMLVQYLLLGAFAIASFLFAFLPFEKIVDRVKVLKERKALSFILFNFLVAYGVVLGRFEHVNSYVVFTNPPEVLRSAANIFVSLDLLGLTVLFGLLCNLVYFLFRGLAWRQPLQATHAGGDRR